jgi:hypothetical protein
VHSEIKNDFFLHYISVIPCRYAKHNLDGRAFYGGILHVCYAPEMESVAETRAKLIQRRKDIAIRTRGDIPCTEQSKLICQSSITSTILLISTDKVTISLLWRRPLILTILFLNSTQIGWEKENKISL